jgi:hypothetical protein
VATLCGTSPRVAWKLASKEHFRACILFPKVSSTRVDLYFETGRLVTCLVMIRHMIVWLDNAIGAASISPNSR